MRKTVCVIAKGHAPSYSYLCGRGHEPKQLFNKNGLVGFIADPFHAHKFVSQAQAQHFLDKHGHKKWDADAQVLRVTFKVESIDSLIMTAPAPRSRQRQLSLIDGGRK